MADLIKRQIIDRLSEYTKGLKPKDISLQFLSGKGELKTLELNPDFINRVLMLPPWIEIHRAKCDSIKCKVPFTKLRSEPISVSINEVLVQVRTCDATEKREKKALKALQSMQSKGKYGLIDRAIDGMSIVIRSIRVEFEDPTFQAQLILNDLSIYSTAPPGVRASSLKDMIIKMKEENTVLIYKELKIQSLRIEASSRAAEHRLATPLRLLVNETIINLSLKRKFSDSSILFAKVVMDLGDLMWILTQRQMKALSTLAQSLTETAIRTFHLEREEKARLHSKKAQGGDGKTKSSSQSSFGGSASFFDPMDLPKVTEWLQKLYMDGNKAMPKWEVIQHSLHLTSHDINIQLCDDEESQDAISGSTLLHITGLSIDVYPDQKAGSGRYHWRDKNDYIDAHLSWTREILHDVIKHKVAASSSQYGSTPSSRDTASLSSGRGSVSNLTNVRDSPRTSRTSASSLTSSSLDVSRRVNYTTTEMDDSDALVIETSISQDLQMMKSSGSSWRGSTESVESLEQSTSPEAVEFSKVRLSRLHERNIVVRCMSFSIDPLSTADGKVSNLPFIQSDKETFKIPPHYPAFQMGVTLYYYPGHTAGKDHLVPRPVLQLNMCPIHAILNQQTCLWLVDFMRGIFTTVDFNLAKGVKQDIFDAVKRLKEKRAKYPMPTTLEGFFTKISIMFTKITLPIFSNKQEPPQDGRPIAIQLETSEIKISTLTKVSLDKTDFFEEMLEYLRSGKLFMTASSDTFPHCKNDLAFLSYECLFRMVIGGGIKQTEPQGPMEVMSNEEVGSGSPWHVECHCVTVQFVHSLKQGGLTSDTKPFIKDFPLSVWVFPSLKEFVESLSSEGEGELPVLFPTVSVLIFINSPISATIERLEFLSILRLKDSLNQFKSDILQRMLPMRDKIQEDIGGVEDDEEDRESPSAVDLLYASGAVVVPGACFRMVLPPIPRDEHKKVDPTQASVPDVDAQREVPRTSENCGKDESLEETDLDESRLQDGVTQMAEQSSQHTDQSSGHTEQPSGHTDHSSGHVEQSSGCAEQLSGNFEHVTFVANVSGIEAIFTARHKGITAKAGIHSVAVEETDREVRSRAASPEISPSDLLHQIQGEPVVKLRADLGDIAEEYFDPSLEADMPDSLVRLQIEGLSLDLIAKHLSSIQSFVDDEIPSEKPVPLDIVVKNTRLAMLDSPTAAKEALTSMNVTVGDVFVNRGPKPKPLYGCVAGSVETLAEEVADPERGSFDSDNILFMENSRVATLRTESELKECITENSSVETSALGQNESVLATFRTFLEEFQSFVSHPEQNLTSSHSSEFMHLLDGMRTSLAAVGVAENRVPPPDYSTAVQADTESQKLILEKLQKMETENTELKERLKVLEDERTVKEEFTRELEQSLIMCKVELAEQKALVLEKDDKLRHLQEEMKQLKSPPKIHANML